MLGLPDDADAALANTKGDIAIVNFDIVLEYLQSALYVEAQRLGALSPKTLGWARVVGAHELAHLAALKGMVDRPPRQPSFNFRGVTENQDSFIKTAVAFEDLTAAILKWQALRLHSREILAAAATLHSVETRHAAWIRRILGLPPVSSAFDEPASQARMARLIDETNFIVARGPVTTGGVSSRATRADDRANPPPALAGPRRRVSAPRRRDRRLRPPRRLGGGRDRAARPLALGRGRDAARPAPAGVPSRLRAGAAAGRGQDALRRGAPPGAVHARPALDAPEVGRVERHTSLGTTSIVLAVGQRRVDGHLWVEVRFPTSTARRAGSPGSRSAATTSSARACSSTGAT